MHRHQYSSGTPQANDQNRPGGGVYKGDHLTVCADAITPQLLRVCVCVLDLKTKPIRLRTTFAITIGHETQSPV